SRVRHHATMQVRLLNDTAPKSISKIEGWPKKRNQQNRKAPMPSVSCAWLLMGAFTPSRCQSLPPAGLITRHKLTNRRNIRQSPQASEGGHRQCAELAGSDVFNRRRHAGEAKLHLSAEQVGESGRVAAIRHVDHTREVIIINSSPNWCRTR